MAFTLFLRQATLDDAPVLEQLILASARGLGSHDYTGAQIEAALGNAWGVDSELLRDGTYFIAEVDGNAAGCGGWSRRRTLFGADGQAGRQSEVLDPRCHSARIRAFFVHPTWARQGIGTALLQRCEEEARAHGFQSAELLATLPGQRLYRKFGYSGEEPVQYPLADGISITFIPMKKAPL